MLKSLYVPWKDVQLKLITPIYKCTKALMFQIQERLGLVKEEGKCQQTISMSY
jgi:hypothetical protein